VRLFDITGTTLSEITEEVFPLERDMQRLTESNLQQIFGLDLVRSEIELHGLRIDTLAFDRESRSFVIVEYKKDRNFSVVDQGVAYLKADFILEYNETSTQSLKRIDVDWSQSRVIFISPEFTKYQQHAIGFKDFAIQLWEIHRYKNGLVIFDEVKPLATKESITAIAKSSSAAKKVSQEIRVYNEDDHLKTADDNIKELYTDLKSGILRHGKDIELRPKKQYVAFRRKQAFASFVFLKSKIKAYLNIEMNQINDPLKKARDVKDIGHYSSGKTEIIITEEGEIPYALSLIIGMKLRSRLDCLWSLFLIMDTIFRH
jgi:predicted transport protein